MNYQAAMEAAGAVVEKFQEFGSYQGDWWARVQHNGEAKWIHGWYGSCSRCDSFQAEFNYQPDACEDHRYVYPTPTDCPACDLKKEEYRTRLSAFGAGYLDTGYFTQEEAEKEASQNLEWDRDAPEMLKFIQDNAI